MAAWLRASSDTPLVPSQPEEHIVRGYGAKGKAFRQSVPKKRRSRVSAYR
jgi:hypothetical protein